MPCCCNRAREGLVSITFLLLVGYPLKKAFERDLAGSDVVVGAKGSPMQLTLSGVLHIDVPPGNVPFKAVMDLQYNPLVASVIPISLGDNLRGFRIVGTSHAYTTHYGATLAQGRMWDAPLQVVVGATAAKKLGIHLGLLKLLGLLSALCGLALGQAVAALLAWGLQLDNSLLIGGMVWPLAVAWRWPRRPRP